VERHEFVRKYLSVFKIFQVNI